MIVVSYGEYEAIWLQAAYSLGLGALTYMVLPVKVPFVRYAYYDFFYL